MVSQRLKAGQPACGEAAGFASPFALENLNRVVVTHYCAFPDQVAMVSVDEATLDPVDLGALQLEDAVAFRAVHSSLDARLRELFQANPGSSLEAHIWFHAHFAGEKSDTDEAALQVATALHESAVRSQAQKLLAKLATIPELELQVGPAPEQYGVPYVPVRGTELAMEKAGQLEEVWRIMAREQAEHTRFATPEDYYLTLRDDYLDIFNFDGTGIVVADFEEEYPNSTWNLPGMLPGTCAPDQFGGPSIKCHCATSTRGWHPRHMTGVIRTQVTSFGGLADQATTISANWFGGCVTNGPDAYSSALNWATTNGASVIFMPTGISPPGNPQSISDLLLDYKALMPPYPTVVAAAGNYGGRAASNLRNGFVVGAASEDGGTDRSNVNFITQTASQNFGSTPAAGMEMPHVTAIGSAVRTAGLFQNSWENTGGTSAASAETAAIMAALQELNSTLKTWPELGIPGLMASANRDTDTVWLNLHDGVDDGDGAGLINGYEAALILAPGSKRDGGWSAVKHGHDYGYFAASSTPQQSFYGETWNISVGAAETLRVAALVVAHPTCPQNPGVVVSPCTASAFPTFALFLNEGTQTIAISGNTNNNYQFIKYTNTTGSTKTLNVRAWLAYWNGLSSTTFGLAWRSGPLD